MFKLLSVVLILALNSPLFGQDTLTVVAVGKAEIEKDPISFILSEDSALSKTEKKSFNNILDIIKSDFKFYQHLFLVDDTVYTKASQVKGRYSVQFSISKTAERFEVQTELKDLKEKKVVYIDKKELIFLKPRAFAHDISHELYRAITGKKSIFKTHIIFVSDRTSTKGKLIKDIYRMDFDGANKRRLTYLKAMVLSPALSQDNSKILYSVIEDKLKKTSDGKKMQKVKNINLHMFDTKTKKTKTISSVDGINSGAIFNKKGDSIYLTLSYLKNADIYKMNLKTRKKTRITNHFSDDVDPHINYDETLLTFLSGRPGKAMIYTMDPSKVEKNVVRIGYVGRFNAAPRFSPDGSEIVFSTWVDNRFDIYRIGSDGRNLVRLTKNFGSNEEPWYSPDGEFIVFTSQRVFARNKAVQDVYIMNRDGEIIRKISENYGKTYTPRWSN
jgi:TolB protein